MCLKALTKSKEKAVLQTLKETFPCWKIIRKNDHCRYDIDATQPKFSIGVHEAQDFPSHRSAIDYRCGFHAYLDEDEAKTILQECLNFYEVDDCGLSCFKLVKCSARKKDIICVGKEEHCYLHPLVAVVSIIERI